MFRNISDAFIFFNIFINEIKIWESKLKSLCVKYRILSHVAKKCTDQMLSAWEQFYFKNIVFDFDIFQINFCAFKYNSFDENVNFYDVNVFSFDFEFRFEFFEFFIENSMSASILAISTPIHISFVIIIRIAIFTLISILIFFSNSNLSVEINSVTYEISNVDFISILFRISIFIEISHVNVMIEKKSDSNKRIYYEMANPISEPASVLSSIDTMKKLKKKAEKNW